MVRKFTLCSPASDRAVTVVHSTRPDYRAFYALILNGWGLGESHWGGFA